MAGRTFCADNGGRSAIHCSDHIADPANGFVAHKAFRSDCANWSSVHVTLVARIGIQTNISVKKCSAKRASGRVTSCAGQAADLILTVVDFKFEGFCNGIRTNHRCTVKRWSNNVNRKGFASDKAARLERGGPEICKRIKLRCTIMTGHTLSASGVKIGPQWILTDQNLRARHLVFMTLNT